MIKSILLIQLSVVLMSSALFAAASPSLAKEHESVELASACQSLLNQENKDSNIDEFNRCLYALLSKLVNHLDKQSSDNDNDDDDNEERLLSGFAREARRAKQIKQFCKRSPKGLKKFW